MRISETECFLGIAKIISKRSTCKRRQYGSVIVKFVEYRKRGLLLSTGYNGAASGLINCCDIDGDCPRKINNTPHNESYGSCYSIHSESNACIQSGDRINNNCILYLYGYDLESNKEIIDPTPCNGCMNIMRNTGIKKYINNTGEYLI